MATRRKWDTTQVSRSDSVRSVLLIPSHATSRNNRELPSPSQSAVSQPSQESLFFFAEASSTFMWSRLSDHIGRKPVLMTVSNHKTEPFVHDGNSHVLGYGWAYNIHDEFRSLQDLHWPRSEVPGESLCDAAVANSFNSRCIAGLLNGNMGVVKSMLGEITDSTNRAQASGLLPLVWAMGVTIGFVTQRYSRRNSHQRATVRLQAGHYRARMKDFRPCSEIGSGKNTRTSYRACSLQFYVHSVSFSRGYS